MCTSISCFLVHFFWWAWSRIGLLSHVPCYCSHGRSRSERCNIIIGRQLTDLRRTGVQKKEKKEDLCSVELICPRRCFKNIPLTESIITSRHRSSTYRKTEGVHDVDVFGVLWSTCRYRSQGNASGRLHLPLCNKVMKHTTTLSLAQESLGDHKSKSRSGCTSSTKAQKVSDNILHQRLFLPFGRSCSLHTTNASGVTGVVAVCSTAGVHRQAAWLLSAPHSYWHTVSVIRGFNQWRAGDVFVVQPGDAADQYAALTIRQTSRYLEVWRSSRLVWNRALKSGHAVARSTARTRGCTA